MSKKKVLVITTTFPRWKGDYTPPFVFELEKRLTGEFEIIVLTPHCLGAKKYEVFDNLEIHRFQYFWTKRWQKLCYGGGILSNIKNNFLLIFQIPFLLLFEFFAIKKIIKNKQIDFIHAHWIIPQGLLSVFIKLLYKVPFIMTVHGSDISRLNYFLIKFFIKLTLQKCDICTVNSSSTKKKLMDIFIPKNIKVLPMGVDTEKFHPSKHDDTLKTEYKIKGPFLLFVGRLSRDKGIEYLIKAMPQIIKKYSDTKLLIIGDGALREFLRELIRKMKIQKNVIIIGGRSNNELPKYYATADVFISPSLTEGQGVTLIEAIVSGTPVIGSNIGGIPEIIKNNETGLLVREKHPDQIAAAVIKLLDNQELREKLVKEGQEYIKQKFDWANVSKQFKAVYSDISI